MFLAAFKLSGGKNSKSDDQNPIANFAEIEPHAVNVYQYQLNADNTNKAELETPIQTYGLF